MLLSAFLFGFFKNPALKPVCGIIEVAHGRTAPYKHYHSVATQTTPHGFSKNPASKPGCGIIEVGARQDCFLQAFSCRNSASPTWIFQKSSIKIEVWYNRDVPQSAHKPTIIPLDNPSGIFLWGTHMRQSAHIIRYNFLEHLVLTPDALFCCG